MSVSIHGACADGAPGPLARCTPTAAPFALTLADGQSLTLVVDGCHETTPCRFTLRAERIAASSAAPETVDLRVFRSARAVTIVGAARDADDDLSLVDVDWLDARGNVLPRTDRLPRILAPWTAVSDRESFWLSNYGAPAQAVGARVQVEDATALVSAARHVAIEAPPVRAQGEACDREGATSACDANTRCVYDRSTGYTCKARLVAHHAERRRRLLRVDLDAHDLAMAFAEVAFLDAAGAELTRTERFAWAPTCCAYDVLGRALLLARDGWRAPVGVARVQTAVFDRDGLRIATLDAPVEAPASAGPWYPCDATTTARVPTETMRTCA